jgi:Flp pilus assembly pilin Flp
MPSALPALVRRLTASRDGATAIEYGLLVALIAIAVTTALGTTGVEIQSVFGSAGNAMS